MQAFHFFVEQGPWNQPLHSRHLLVYLFVHDCPCARSTFLVELGRCLLQLICHSREKKAQLLTKIMVNTFGKIM